MKSWLIISILKDIGILTGVSGRTGIGAFGSQLSVLSARLQGIVYRECLSPSPPTKIARRAPALHAF